MIVHTTNDKTAVVRVTTVGIRGAFRADIGVTTPFGIKDRTITRPRVCRFVNDSCVGMSKCMTNWNIRPDGT